MVRLTRDLNSQRQSSSKRINAAVEAARLENICFKVSQTNPMWYAEKIEAISNREYLGDEATKIVFKTGLKSKVARWVKFVNTGTYTINFGLDSWRDIGRNLFSRKFTFG